MPHRTFSLEEIATYLHLSKGDVETLVKHGEIPHEKRGGRLVFRRQDVDAWASQRILGLPGRHLVEYHQQSSHGTREVFPTQAIVPEMLRPEFILANLAGKTRASVVREMVELAESTDQVCDPKELLASLEARETLCSTGLPGGLAVMHPRHHQPYMFESSFMVLGRAVQDIHFGAPDGLPTRLFFLICCQDDRIHLHTLARICMMAQKTTVLAQLRELADTEAMFEALVAAEVEVLKKV